MKKKIISIVGLALFVGAVVFNVHINLANNDQLSDVTLKNIEAMAESLTEVDCSDSCLESQGGMCERCMAPYCEYYRNAIKIGTTGQCTEMP